MPNDNTAVCGCGVVLDLPKSRNGMTAISTRNFTILIPKSGKSSGNLASKIEVRAAGKKPTEQERAVRGANSREDDYSDADRHRRQRALKMRSTRRTRSAERAERAESHYTYIDSGSSIVGSGIRENAIAEALYCTIDDDLVPPQQQQQQQQQQAVTTPASSAATASQQQQQQQQQPQQQQQQPNTAASTPNNRAQQPLYAVPSMTSPPPTYDVAIAKSWQSGLPPTYEEYLCHKHALVSRSHTPPPPWTDSAAASASSHNIRQLTDELMASQPELREYLTRLALQGGAEQAAQQYHQLLTQQQALRKQAARAQRTRAMPPRSQSESRAQQQRIATMYEDGAFCMETTAIQGAFEHGVAFCSLM